MPRYVRRFKRFRRRYGRSRGGGTSFARIARVSRSVAERKYKDFGIHPGETMPFIFGISPSVGNAQFAVPQEFLWFNLCGAIDQGTTVSTRIGNRIFVRYLQMSIVLAYAGAQVPSNPTLTQDMMANGCRCRYVVAMDRQHGGMETVGDEYFADSDSSFQVYNLRNYSTLGKFRTLLDKQHNLTYSGTVQAPSGGTEIMTSGTGVSVIQHFIKINRTIDMTAFRQDLKDGRQNPKNLLMFGICSSMPSHCFASINVRLCFNDS